MPTDLQPLPGALVRDFKTCGRAGCKCATGEKHGPYFVRVWYENGKRRKSYVRPDDVARVVVAIELREIEHRAARVRAHLARRLSAKQRGLCAGSIERLEREAETLRAAWPDSSTKNLETPDESARGVATTASGFTGPTWAQLLGRDAPNLGE